MMKQPLILLDPIGDAEVPTDYTVVETETDFVRLAVEDRPLLVRNERLCNWARDFYKARAIDFREVKSQTREIQAAAPRLSAEQAHNLYKRIGSSQFAAMVRPIKPHHLLQVLYPRSMWTDPPSLQHAAEWLLWLFKENPDPLIRALFVPLLDGWRNAAGEPVQTAYEAADFESARRFLHAWLYINPLPRFADLGEFPETVPPDLVNEAREIWAQNIIDSQGAFFFDSLERAHVPGVLRRAAADETVAYLKKNPEQLNQERFRTLARFIGSKSQEQLTTFLPPEPPSALPNEISSVLTWFEEEYLPFRMWQMRHGNANAKKTAEAVARQFAEWYLLRYPKGLVGGQLRDHLSFRQPVAHSQDNSLITIIVVLDGLHADDAQQLIMAIEQEAPRLALLQRNLVFAPVPTVTQFAKDALLKGLAPSEAKGQTVLAEVLSERFDPTSRLKEAHQGDILIWRVMEPDKTYHDLNYYETLSREVDAALTKVAMEIGDIVDNLPDDLPLQVIVTTDHGRLLDRAQRSIPVPEGMESHGRAAWGKRQHEYDSTGVIFDGDVAFLHGERFGLPEEASEAAVVIGPNMFKTNDDKRGSEVYPHGGAYPEEIIVPWLVLQRDWKTPTVPIKVIGSGVTGRKDQAKVEVINSSDVNLLLTHLTLRFSANDVRSVDLGLAVGPRTKNEAQFDLDPWPTEAETTMVTVTANLQMPTGQNFEEAVEVAIESEEMYRRDNILEDLDI